ncbi:phospholipase effector Tle1 domain-containing protein [Gimesia chilikensis]|uniref:phospholipase effector Tle1 domain-containing protein n=1 Tax=Gimesia chilikensis TaxID=2605989 RepID=UPI00165959E7|nr:DUF2235 domain-containing protein [Gimesia chilikensis]
MMTRLLLTSITLLVIGPTSLTAKDLVVLMDGTWNNSIDYGGRRESLKFKSLFSSGEPLLITEKSKLVTPLPPQATNIARMYMLLDNDAEQKVAYIRGIGSGEGDKFRGGALGKGAEERVKAALKFIEDNWQRGDEICIFGFSRGAATARQLARRSELNGKKIRFMGLFDTVAAFGMPQTRLSLSDGVRKQFEDFHNKLAIPNDVGSVVHLVALDEKRMTFLPTLILPDLNHNNPRRKEIWFSGNHGDIGGGWDDEPNATYRRRQIALRYMLKQGHGLDLPRNWRDHADVRVDPTWQNLGVNHAYKKWTFLEGYGGEQKRENLGDTSHPNFAVPYRPPLNSIFVHESIRQK